jgi:lysozyme family protein
MANYSLLLQHIAKWEGGLSSDPRDTCAKVSSGIVNPKKPQETYHTNKGICYSTWKANAPKLGFDPGGKAFVNMTTEQWRAYVKKIFWDGKNLDLVNNQAIAELIFETYWGSGNGGARPLVRFMQQQINHPIDGLMNTATIKALNQYTQNNNKANALYKAMWNYRLNWLKKLADNPKYTWALKGWTNRMNALLKRSGDFLTSTPGSIAGVLLVMGVSFFLLFKYGK